jgi:hypothetical protein
MRAMLGRIKRGVLSGRIAARMDDGGSPDLQRNSIAHQLVRAPLSVTLVALVATLVLTAVGPALEGLFPTGSITLSRGSKPSQVSAS